MAPESLAISPVICTDGYTLKGKICSTPVSFLLDTWAAVTLLREDLWKKIDVDGERAYSHDQRGA